VGYKPSPRPSFETPTVIRAADAVRHTWGDEAAGFVEDWIYVSSQQIHVIVFGLEPGGYRRQNAFWNSFAISDLVETEADPRKGELKDQTARIKQAYADLSDNYQASKSGNDIPLN